MAGQRQIFLALGVIGQLRQRSKPNVRNTVKIRIAIYSFFNGNEQKSYIFIFKYYKKKSREIF